MGGIDGETKRFTQLAKSSLAKLLICRLLQTFQLEFVKGLIISKANFGYFIWNFVYA